MTSLKSSYGELIALTQLYLLRECSEIRNLTVSPDALLDYQKLNLPKTSTNSKSAPQPQPKIPLKEFNQTHSAPLLPHRPDQSQEQPRENSPLAVKPSTLLNTSSEIKTLPTFTISPEKSGEPEASAVEDRDDRIASAISEKQSSTDALRSRPISDEMGKVAKTIALTPLAPYSGPPPQFKEIRSFFQTHFHQIPLETDIPDDRTAKQKKNQWQEVEKIPPILILSFDEGVKSLAFLKNIAQAITHRLLPARVVHAPKIENEKQWATVLNAQGLQLIIASDYGLYLQPQLMQFHQEHPQEGKHFLNHIPLLLLSDLEFYFKNGKMKAYLWRAICTEFAAMKGK